MTLTYRVLWAGKTLKWVSPTRLLQSGPSVTDNKQMSIDTNISDSFLMGIT